MSAGKAPAASQIETTQIILPGDTNALGTAFGGKVMQWIDIAAAICARRHVQGIAVTASIDSLQFIAPIHLGDLLIFKASINRAWRTSMEVGVRVECESATTYTRSLAASAYLTFVAVDESGRPKQVPPVLPQTESDLRRFTAAEARRNQRLQSRHHS
jgi:acyl-CoA hydrolase